MTELTPTSWPEKDPAPPGGTPAHATDPAVRQRWNQALAVLREKAAADDPFLFARELLERARLFEETMSPTYRRILGTALLWSDAERAFVQWAKEAFHTLARIASGALRRAAAQDALLNGSGGELAALSLATFGNSIKWAEIASAGYDPVSLVEVRRVHEMVERAGLGHEHFTVPRDDRAASPTLDALFFRAMLLDAVCRGNLDPRQVEIVDSWLWEWCGEYSFTDSDAGAVLPLEPGRQRGLRAPHGEERARRYLRIDALEDQIKRVVDAFRRGEIYPGYGCAIDFRVEEHAAALDFLRRFLESARYRRARESREGREEALEALVGLGEVLQKAFSPRTSPLAPAHPAREGVRPASGQPPGIDSLYDIPRRVMRVLDESADGVGAEFEDDPNRAVSVGTIVTLHHDNGAPPVLCEVMRRSLSQGGTVRVGLRILSRAPRKVELWRPGDAAGLHAIYVPSEDASGHVDSLLVAESDFNPRENFEVRFDDRVFVIRMNRVRYHGRGWHLAGFEVREERERSRG